jgi:hypothetical protein
MTSLQDHGCRDRACDRGVPRDRRGAAELELVAASFEPDAARLSETRLNSAIRRAPGMGAARDPARPGLPRAFRARGVAHCVAPADVVPMIAC